MKEPDVLKKDIQVGDIQVQRPAEGLKPGEDFEKILAAYKNWCIENPDRGYTAFMAARQGSGLLEDTSWQIRGSLRRMGTPNAPKDTARALKWHLILHMTQEIERQSLEADLLLRDLKEKKSPIQNILDPEGEEGVGVFHDLPSFHAEPSVHESHWDQVLESWLGLFGLMVGASGILVTFDKRVLEFLWALRDQPSMVEVSQEDRPLRLNIPVRPTGTSKRREETGGEGPDGEFLRELWALLGDKELSPDTRMKGLRRLAEEIETSSPRGLRDGMVEIRITTLAFPPENSLSRDMKSLVPLTGKTVVFVGDR